MTASESSVSKLERVDCHHLCDPEVVENFKDDKQIRCLSVKSIFLHEVRVNTINCRELGHSGCLELDSFKRLHTDLYKELLKKSHSSFRSVYVPNPSKLKIGNDIISIEGGITSLDPPCQQNAVNVGDHPFTCNNFHHQLCDLKFLIIKRRSSVYHNLPCRVGKNGFCLSYARHNEALLALECQKLENIEVRKVAHQALTELKAKRSSKDWEDLLVESCLKKDEAKLGVNLTSFLKENIAEKNPIQVDVIRNMAGKLKSKNYHHYIETIKDISALHKNKLGTRNYQILADIFKLASASSARNHFKSDLKYFPGFNEGALDRARKVYSGLPVIECSDEARALRYLDVREDDQGDLELVGICFDPDVEKWGEGKLRLLNEGALDRACKVYSGLPVIECSDEARALRYLDVREDDQGDLELVGICFDPNIEKWGEGKLRLPKQDKSLGDKDDFMALKRLIDDAILNESLAKSVSIHNVSSLCSPDKPDIVHCLWPTPNVGYKGVLLLKILNTISQKCYENSASLEKNSLVGFSTDSAGFSLAASVINMTPSDKQVEQGFYFLSLGIDEERFVASYFSDLPFISFLDHDHERRLFLKCLKYKTLDLYIWRDDENGSCCISIEHLKELREINMNDGISCDFSALDLELSLFFDQNTDAADRVFRLEVADMLDRYVPGSMGTSLFIRAVYCLTHPFHSLTFGSPFDVQESVSAGITVFRLWRKVVELQKGNLRSKAGAKQDPKL